MDRGIASPRRPRAAALTTLVVAASSGALWGLLFGVRTYEAAPWLALAPLVLLLGRPRAWLAGWVHGAVAWAVAMPWIVPTLATYGGLPVWLSTLCLAGLAAFLGGYHALFAALGAGIWRRGGPVTILVGLPALWVVLEVARSRLATGFPWNLAAYSVIDVPGALGLAPWIGAWGVGGLVVLVNVAVALAARRRRFVPALAVAGLVLVALAAGARWGAGAWNHPLPSVAGRGLPVRLLQPNTENLVTWDAERVEAGYQRILAMSRRACDRPGALVVWPESAAWPYAWERDPRLRADLGAIVEAGCPVLLNTPMGDGADGYFNSVLLVGRSGPEGRYDKRHLVPWGEYVPLARVLPFMSSIARGIGDFRAGNEVALLDWAGTRLGVAICFEVTFPSEVAALVRAGAGVLVTVTNDAWYGDSSAPHQHFRAARFRAAETRRPLIRAAITGISAVVGPDGRVRAELGVGEEGVLAATVVPGSGSTPAARRPFAVPAVCLVLGLSAILRASRRRSTP